MTQGERERDPYQQVVSDLCRLHSQWLLTGHGAPDGSFADYLHRSKDAAAGRIVGGLMLATGSWDPIVDAMAAELFTRLEGLFEADRLSEETFLGKSEEIDELVGHFGRSPRFRVEAGRTADLLRVAGELHAIRKPDNPDDAIVGISAIVAFDERLAWLRKQVRLNPGGWEATLEQETRAQDRVRRLLGFPPTAAVFAWQCAGDPADSTPDAPAIDGATPTPPSEG